MKISFVAASVAAVVAAAMLGGMACAQAPSATTPSATTPSAATPSAAAPIAAASAANAVFPSAVDAKYSKETAGKARKDTCLDQYKANKKANANGGLKWLAKDGYYSQCNKKLKGGA